MKIMVYECKKCGDKIYSRTNHDCISCSCAAIAVDGGRWDNDLLSWVPFRLIGELQYFSDRQFIEKDISSRELYDDWNYHDDKYGIIKKEL